MTDQPPPPPPGGYPPPPPPQGGAYPPPPSGQAAGFPPAQAPQALPTEAYTPWLTRVLAFLIDMIPVFILEAIGWGMLAGTRETVCVADTSGYDLGEFCAEGASTLGLVSFYICMAIALAYLIWNYGYRQGTTGSSIGKSVMKCKIISEKTGQPIGFGPSVVRQLLYMVAGLFFGIVWLIAVLFPLWDAKRQTLVDKIVTTVCVPL
ncbi:RDD family protein [Mycobacterium hubeiense]|uniref:RDD family protein n=1 Tax=Mycobacterium hubeiense TaxID=1867256 RepID=UPI000C7F15A6|nr:RDD family protein [Mycobacterium sp. QGD 101]